MRKSQVVMSKFATKSSYDHGRPQKFFQGGEKSTFCLSFCGFWRCNANWRIQKRKCPMLRQQLHTVLSLYENFTPCKCLL